MNTSPIVDEKLKHFLDTKAAQYEQPSFIHDDPIGIPHRFSKIQDVEIAGFFAAILAWGNRKSIIRSCHRLLAYMNNAPYDFILNFEEPDLATFSKFVHRTFNAVDLFHFFDFLQHHYKTQKQPSLETAFTKHLILYAENTASALTGFHSSFFDVAHFPNYPHRTTKHIASPAKKSACKRLNMFLRWMVRSNQCGVDFGIWKNIRPAQLVCPLDVHVVRVAKRLNLLQRSQTDWQAAIELTQRLKQINPQDPIRYDFALFGLGVVEKF